MDGQQQKPSTNTKKRKKKSKIKDVKTSTGRSNIFINLYTEWILTTPTGAIKVVGTGVRGAEVATPRRIEEQSSSNSSVDNHKPDPKIIRWSVTACL